jgi:hypothetical protein
LKNIVDRDVIGVMKDMDKYDSHQGFNNAAAKEEEVCPRQM